MTKEERSVREAALDETLKAAPGITLAFFVAADGLPSDLFRQRGK